MPVIQRIFSHSMANNETAQFCTDQQNGCVAAVTTISLVVFYDRFSALNIEISRHSVIANLLVIFYFQILRWSRMTVKLRLINTLDIAMHASCASFKHLYWSCEQSYSFTVISHSASVLWQVILCHIYILYAFSKHSGKPHLSHGSIIFQFYLLFFSALHLSIYPV